MTMISDTWTVVVINVILIFNPHSIEIFKETLEIMRMDYF